MSLETGYHAEGTFNKETFLPKRRKEAVAVAVSTTLIAAEVGTCWAWIFAINSVAQVKSKNQYRR